MHFLKYALIIKLCWAYKPTSNSKGAYTFISTGHRWSITDELGVLEISESDLPTPPIIPKNRTIFIGISAYRDHRCGRTIFDVFNKAKYPEHITIGVLEQTGPGDSRCIETYCLLWKEKLDISGELCPFKSQIIVSTMSYEHSTGPALARSYQQDMITDQDFCLQVDAHTLFVEHFDVELVSMFARTKNEHAVLSTYIQDIYEMRRAERDDAANELHEVPHICALTAGPMSHSTFLAYNAYNLHAPKLNYFWGAGLSFSKCHAEYRVPYDRNLPGVFYGEEITRAIRFFTHGYDMYTPDRNFVFHVRFQN